LYQTSAEYLSINCAKSRILWISPLYFAVIKSPGSRFCNPLTEWRINPARAASTINPLPQASTEFRNFALPSLSLRPDNTAVGNEKMLTNRDLYNMAHKYKEYQQLNLPAISQEILAKWEADRAFEISVELREGSAPFVFYEGPPSANGLPGIHHVISRTLKDLVCRYKTMKGFQVKRKGGWDTHGLPVELGVEKMLGITKEDIGKTISIAEYNETCRREVLKYKDKWDELTRRMGYWVDLKNPYITFENKYIETLWWLLGELYRKGLLYESVSIQPYSPAAGTGLSSHELNQPGCYKDVKDTSVVAMFRLSIADTLMKGGRAVDTLARINDMMNKDKDTGDVFFMAWTTTPWTLPSNLGLTVGPRIDYVLVKTVNPYTHERANVILAKALLGKYFKPEVREWRFFSAIPPSLRYSPGKSWASSKGASWRSFATSNCCPLKLTPRTNPAATPSGHTWVISLLPKTVPASSTPLPPLARMTIGSDRSLASAS
jgi:hypothetical protein